MGGVHLGEWEGATHVCSGGGVTLEYSGEGRL